MDLDCFITIMFEYVQHSMFSKAYCFSYARKLGINVSACSGKYCILLVYNIKSNALSTKNFI